MSEPRHLAGGGEMLDPLAHPPPRGRRMLLVTAGGICIVGTWSDDCIAWHPLLKVPNAVKQRNSLTNRGERDEPHANGAQR